MQDCRKSWRPVRREGTGGGEEEGADMEDGKGEVEKPSAEEPSWDDVCKLVKFARFFFFFFLHH